MKSALLPAAIEPRRSSRRIAAAVRVAADYRKRGFVKREATGHEVPEQSTGETQTAAIERKEALTRL